MNPNAPAAQIGAIHTELKQSPYIKSCIFRSQAYDYNEAKLILPADEVQATTAGGLPVLVPLRAQRPVPGAGRLPAVHRQAGDLRASSTPDSRSRPCRA